MLISVWSAERKGGWPVTSVRTRSKHDEVDDVGHDDDAETFHHLLFSVAHGSISSRPPVSSRLDPNRKPVTIFPRYRPCPSGRCEGERKGVGSRFLGPPVFCISHNCNATILLYASPAAAGGFCASTSPRSACLLQTRYRSFGASAKGVRSMGLGYD